MCGKDFWVACVVRKNIEVLCWIWLNMRVRMGLAKGSEEGQGEEQLLVPAI